jgi:membrane protease YdiL (CAAX protease family)
VFRGIIFRLLERGLGSIIALVLSTLMFGAIHLMNPGASLMGALVVAAGGGVIFTCAFLLTRSLWLAIGLHWAADFWQGPVFGLHPSGQTFAHPLIHSTMAGPHLWTGGIFGGGLVALVLVVPISAAMVLAVARRDGFRPPPAKLTRALGIARG